MAEKFTGFDPSLFKFLEELGNNNKKTWFEANKQRYKDEVVAPISLFIEAIAPSLKKISPYVVADPRPNGGSMFRIYRDVRFSKDKRPYKEHAGVRFRHSQARERTTPGFYIHLSPTEIFYGGGVFGPPSPALAQIRQAIADNPDHWKKATRGKKFVETFGDIRGSSLTRPPRGFDADLPFIEDIKRKSFSAMTKGTHKQTRSASFTKDVTDAMKVMKPFMKFLADALDVPF